MRSGKKTGKKPENQKATLGSPRLYFYIIYINIIIIFYFSTKI